MLVTNRRDGQADSFFVGGGYVEQPDGSHVIVGQIFVRRFDDGGADLLPVVLLHGGAQTGSHYEVTPDGRPGLAPLLAALGRVAYVIDLPGVGRSRYHAEHYGPLLHYTAELMEVAFTAPAPDAWPGADRHTQWPGSGRRGDPVFDAFYASQVGGFRADVATEATVRAAVAALLDRVGPCHLLTHSQAGPYGWHSADARPDLVRSIVSLEPNGPPFFDPYSDVHSPPRRPYGITSAPLTYDPPLAALAGGLPFEVHSQNERTSDVRQASPARGLTNLRDTPVLLVTGEASYHSTYDYLTARFLRDAGVDVDHAQLGERGIHGNGHLFTIELNNATIAELIHQWLTSSESKTYR